MANSVIKASQPNIIELASSSFPYTPLKTGILFIEVENGGTGTVTIQAQQGSERGVTVTSEGKRVSLVYPCYGGIPISLTEAHTGTGTLFLPRYRYYTC